MLAQSSDVMLDLLKVGGGASVPVVALCVVMRWVFAHLRNKDERQWQGLEKKDERASVTISGIVKQHNEAFAARESQLYAVIAQTNTTLATLSGNVDKNAAATNSNTHALRGLSQQMIGRKLVDKDADEMRRPLPRDAAEG